MIAFGLFVAGYILVWGAGTLIRKAVLAPTPGERVGCALSAAVWIGAAVAIAVALAVAVNQVTP